ncbi:MAG: hypothetical protein JRF27_05170 [Deltaproteobacteria bacterium]|nr:hypothetical protein [Deltaproteobacteria bacterium]MBW2193163.1 hypothetical protein [Deltaproteobacteria bacterium]
MSMYFYDETDDWPEYKIVQDEIKRLEREHPRCRKELQEAEVAFHSDAENEDLKARVEVLSKKLKAIEKKLDASLSMYR